jgi:hypothetical protein
MYNYMSIKLFTNFLIKLFQIFNIYNINNTNNNYNNIHNNIQINKLINNLVLINNTFF